MGNKTVVRPGGGVSGPQKVLVVLVGLVCGYLLGYIFMQTADKIYTSHQVILDAAEAARKASQAPPAKPTLDPIKKLHTVHSLITGNGSPYQNFQARMMELSPHSIHSVFTSGSDSTGYQSMQARVMYGTYKLVQEMPGGEFLTGFTRILHRMTDDNLMDEIPTFRATPLHPECDVWCDFPVADRPNAVAQWVEAVKGKPEMLQGAWVLLLECDYVWMKPLAAPDASDPSVVGWQFHFDYIMPQHPDCAHIIKRLAGGRDTAKVPASGPAPAMMRFDTWTKVVPAWERVTAALEADAEAVKVLDWVREMYAWDVAVFDVGVELLTQAPPLSPLIAQPPHDTSLGHAAMFHYTWGAIFNDSTGEIWRFEKRDYTAPEHALKVPHLPMPPPEWKKGWILQDQQPVSQALHATMAAMVGQMNKAIDRLPDLSARAAGQGGAAAARRLLGRGG